MEKRWKRKRVVITLLAVWVVAMIAALTYVAYGVGRHSYNDAAVSSSERMCELLQEQGYGSFEETTDEDSASAADADQNKAAGCCLTEDVRQRARMAEDILDDLGYEIIRRDSDESGLMITFVFEDERMRINVAGDAPGLVVIDNAWERFPADNYLAKYAMCETINDFNRLFPFKIAYFTVDDVIHIYTRQQVLIDEYTPNKTGLIEAIVRSMIRVHKYFPDYMRMVMSEAREKNLH